MKIMLKLFQGHNANQSAPEADAIGDVLPDDGRFVYDMHRVILGIVDVDSFIETGKQYGTAIIPCFARLEGKPINVIAVIAKCLEVQLMSMGRRS